MTSQFTEHRGISPNLQWKVTATEIAAGTGSPVKPLL